MSVQQQLARADIYFMYTRSFLPSQKINTNKASLSPITKNQLCLENQYH